MEIHVVTFSVVTALLALLPPAQGTEVPSSVRLTAVEILWESGGGDGCASPHCANYRITLRGDGNVRVEDLGWGGQPPRLSVQIRSVKEDEFVAILNELLDARFLEVPDLTKTRRAHRQSDLLYFYYHGNDSGAWVDLTLHAGPYRKTLRIPYSDTTALRSVVDRIWRIGGVNAQK